MQVALEISFYNIDDSLSADEYIRSHLAYLRQIHDGIGSCRVRVAQRAANDNQAVLIELGIAGQNNLVVSHEANRAHSTFELDVHQTISEAFRKAEEALCSLRNIHAVNARIARQSDIAFLGHIAEVYPLQDYGYILDGNGRRICFHRDAVIEGDFDYLVGGDEAIYIEENGMAGPLATRVWIRRSAA